jgi:hypothetical protein
MDRKVMLSWSFWKEVMSVTDERNVLSGSIGR